MALKSGIVESNLTGGIINIEATISQNCSNLVTWDLDSMKWLENGSISEDGRTVTGKYSMSNTEITIPGKQTLVFVLKVEGAGNRTEIEPSFKFGLEGNNENEKVSLLGNKTIVSAKPKYNVEFKRNTELQKEIMLEENGKQQNGRLYGYSLTYQLYNNQNIDKALKGIEYPKGDINLDIKLKLEKASISNPNDVKDITESTTPILYNYKMNTYDNSSGFIPNRNMVVGFHSAHEWQTAGAFGGGLGNCYDSGKAKMIQKGKEIKVNLTNYKFNGKFPVKYVGYENDRINYTKNIGCFSSVYFQIFIPFTEESSEKGYNYYLTLEESNLEVYSNSGVKLQQQSVTGDDISKVQHTRHLDGQYSKYHWLIDNWSTGQSSHSSQNLASDYRQGDARAEIGEKFVYNVDITAASNNDIKDDIYDANVLMKFDGEAFKITEKEGSIWRTGNISTNSFFESDMEFKMLYAGKKDGTNYVSDEEMKTITEDDLLFFKTEEELKKNLGENSVCVGVLFESINGKFSAASGINLQIALEATNKAKVSEVYQFVSSSKLYKKDKKLDRSVQTKENPNAQFPEPDVSYKLNYVKTKYDENGNIVTGTHNGGYTYGQSLLIVSGKVSVEHSIEDKISTGKEKVNYDIGKNESTVTFGIKPQLISKTNTGESIGNITVKIIETLPKGLKYVHGSSNYKEPNVKELEDGREELTWYMYNCTIGKDIEKIIFKAQINQESQNGQQYTANVLVSADEIGTSLPKLRTDSSTINIINLASHRLYKETENPIIEKGENIEYSISYKNNTEEPVNEFQLLDILPYNGDRRGTKYNGTYILENIELVGQTGLKIYTTTEETVKNITAKDENIGKSPMWKEVTAGRIGEEVKGIAVKGTVNEKNKVDIKLTLKPESNLSKDIYVNNVTTQTNKTSEVMTSTNIKVQVVSRTIKGKIWEDSNRNGVIDSTEKYLEGTTVKLLNNTNIEIARTTSNAQGEYEFTNLVKGTYKVEVEIDNLHELTEKEIGTNREINSKFNQSSRQTDEITKLNTISSPEIIEENVNAGIRKIQYNITTKVEGIGGNISGEGKTPYESVDKGENSVKDLIITPNEGYIVERITVNGEPISFKEEANHTIILNKFINMQEDKEIIVKFKDVRTSVLVHHYKENTTERLSRDVIINGEVGDNYTTQVATDIPQNYELVAEPANKNGTMTESQIVVTYYYRLKTPTVNEQSINKNGTEKIENLTDEITYDIVYKAIVEDYIGEAEVTIVDKLPYPIVVDSSELAEGRYDATGNTITWTEIIKDINSYENRNNEITINKKIKVVYTGINQETTNIKNVVTGKIKTKTPEKEFYEVTANHTTTTGFTINIPVSKVWEDDNNRLGQRPTKVLFKLTGSDGNVYTKELAKPGTEGSTTTQDSNNPNKWNDIFENLPKYDINKQEIDYTLTEITGNLKYYEATVDKTSRMVTNTNKYGEVTVHHYIMNTDGSTTTTKVPSTSGAEVQDVVIEGKVGDKYKTESAKNINEKYELVAEKLPANATGTLEKYNTEKPQEVIYYYKLKP
ncbi:MAG: SdrD B-like domain-containing protein, partial [Clostridia bacterium]|nr:SdrD B-like domain-containing protein [Clostridia bacterium]